LDKVNLRGGMEQELLLAQFNCFGLRNGRGLPQCGKPPNRHQRFFDQTLH
jgi:hypothetical protein